MKVLLVSPKPPWPPVDGGTFSIARMAVGLARAGHRVHVLSAATPKHPGDGSVPAGLSAERVAVDTSIRPLRLLSSLAARAPYATARFASGAFSSRLEALLGEEAWDVVQLEGLGTYPSAGLIRRASRGRLVVRAHNVEHALFRERARGAGNPAEAAFLHLEARRVERLERATWRLADGIAAIGPEVAAACAAAAPVPVATLPVGVEVPSRPPPIGDPTVLLHLSAMDWWPNREGLSWFLSEVWPHVRRVRAAATLRLAGRGMDQFARSLPPDGLSVEGEVPDAAEFLRSGAILVVPLLSGSGVRVKIVEAMAEGRAVVATSRAVEGLGGAVHGEHLLVGDGAEGLAASILLALGDAALVARLGKAAWRFASERFSAPAVARAVTSFYHSLAPAAE
ncbi:MAG: glycosyltransferase [Holophagales bacterium]|nr:glycosyltransferase [Holophagales bacterium]MBK9964391.1 glycosyltransferase [Holophagales bacterium]